MGDGTAAGADGGHGTGGGGAHGDGRRRRRWPALLGVVLAVATVVAVVLVLVNREPAEPVQPQVLEPEVVTLPVPTPTVSPVEVEAGSAFLAALPRTVLQFAATEVGDAPDPVAAGALEGHRFVYDDGTGTTIVLHAGQWRDAAGAEAALDGVIARESERSGLPVESTDAPQEHAPGSPEPGATAGPDGEPADEPGDPMTPRLEQGAVEVAGEPAGRYLRLTREDGTGSVWWTNGTALLRLDGPADAVRDVFAAFPL